MICPSHINPEHFYYTLRGYSLLFSAVDFIYYSIVLLKSELSFTHPPDCYLWEEVSPFSSTQITTTKQKKQKKRNHGVSLLTSLVFFPFKNYAALAVVLDLSSLEKCAERERERGDNPEPETRDHGGTSRTGHPT